jgi:hypothetical protein
MDIEPEGRSGDGEEKEGNEEKEQPERKQSDWDDELHFDEDFIRGAEVREPAARTRMLRDRWRESPPEPQPWRADDPPAGGLFSKSRRRARKRRRRGEEDDAD